MNKQQKKLLSLIPLLLLTDQLTDEGRLLLL